MPKSVCRSTSQRVSSRTLLGQGRVVVVVALGEQLALALQRVAATCAGNTSGTAAGRAPCSIASAADPAPGTPRPPAPAASRPAARAGPGAARSCRPANSRPPRSGRLRKAPGDVAGRVHHFVDAVGVEDVLVEVVGVAVVAEIQPHHFEAAPRAGARRSCACSWIRRCLPSRAAAAPGRCGACPGTALCQPCRRTPSPPSKMCSVVTAPVASSARSAAAAAQAAGTQHRSAGAGCAATSAAGSRRRSAWRSSSGEWSMARRIRRRAASRRRCARAPVRRCGGGLPARRRAIGVEEAAPRRCARGSPSRRRKLAKKLSRGPNATTRLRVAARAVAQRDRLHRHAGLHRRLEDACVERADFASHRGCGLRGTRRPAARPAGARSISCITPPSDSWLPRWWKMVSPRAASQPTSGQPRISCLATKPIMRWLCSISMSTQLTWLATNITGPGSGVPIRRRRKPKIRISPADHSLTARCSMRSATHAQARPQRHHAQQHQRQQYDRCGPAAGERGTGSGTRAPVRRRSWREARGKSSAHDTGWVWSCATKGTAAVADPVPATPPHTPAARPSGCRRMQEVQHLSNPFC